jgi:hypothetical protein
MVATLVLAAGTLSTPGLAKPAAYLEAEHDGKVNLIVDGQTIKPSLWDGSYDAASYFKSNAQARQDMAQYDSAIHKENIANWTGLGFILLYPVAAAAGRMNEPIFLGSYITGVVTALYFMGHYHDDATFHLYHGINTYNHVYGFQGTSDLGASDQFREQSLRVERTDDVVARQRDSLFSLSLAFDI